MQFSSYYASRVVIYDRKYVYKIGHWSNCVPNILLVKNITLVQFPDENICLFHLLSRKMFLKRPFSVQSDYVQHENLFEI